MVASSGFEFDRSLYGVVVGPWTRIERIEAKERVIGGEPPAKILVFPFPKWQLVDDEPGKHLITDEAAQAAILAHFRKHGVDVVVDYEHSSTRSEGKAIAAGWITELTGEGKAGLVAEVSWTDDAKDEIRKGQYRYHSPVAIYDKKTRRVIALHSVALTNTPRTDNQAPITEQVAASLVAQFEAKGGSDAMKWKEKLIYFLNLPYTAATDEIREHLGRVLEALETDSAEAADKPEEGATIAAAIGFVPVSEIEARVKAASVELADKTEQAASAEVIRLLGLEEGAELADVTARIIELKHPEGMVPASRVAELEERLAALDETAKKDRVTKLLETYSAKITPATTGEFRALAEANYDLAEATLRKMQDAKPAKVASGSDPEPREIEEVAGTIEVDGQEFKVDPRTAQMAASIKRIAKEKGLSYDAAADEYQKGLEAAS